MEPIQTESDLLQFLSTQREETGKNWRECVDKINAMINANAPKEDFSQLHKQKIAIEKKGKKIRALIDFIAGGTSIGELLSAYDTPEEQSKITLMIAKLVFGPEAKAYVPTKKPVQKNSYNNYNKNQYQRRSW